MIKRSAVFRVPQHGNNTEHLKTLSVPACPQTLRNTLEKTAVLLCVPVFRVFPPIGASVARNNRAHHTLPTGGVA